MKGLQSRGFKIIEFEFRVKFRVTRKCNWWNSVRNNLAPYLHIICMLLCIIQLDKFQQSSTGTRWALDASSAGTWRSKTTRLLKFIETRTRWILKLTDRRTDLLYQYRASRQYAAWRDKKDNTFCNCSSRHFGRFAAAGLSHYISAAARSAISLPSPPLDWDGGAESLIGHIASCWQWWLGWRRSPFGTNGYFVLITPSKILIETTA